MLGGEEEGEKKKSSKREGHTLVGDVRGLGDREEELSRIFWANTRVLVYLGAKKKEKRREEHGNPQGYASVCPTTAETLAASIRERLPSV